MKKSYIKPTLTQIEITNLNIVCTGSFSPDATDMSNINPTPEDADLAASRINVWEE